MLKTGNEVLSNDNVQNIPEVLVESEVLRSRTLVTELLELDRELRTNKQFQERGVSPTDDDSTYLWLESKMFGINVAKKQLCASVAIVKSMGWEKIQEPDALKYGMPRLVSQRFLKAKELFQGFMDVSYNIVPMSDFEDIVLSSIQEFRDDEDIEGIFSTARLAFVSILGIDSLPYPMSADQCGSLLLNILRSLSTGNRKIGFAQIICPEIYPDALLEENQSQYVAKRSGNQARIAIESATKIISVLRFWGIQSKWLVILADNDESEYIYPVLQRPQLLNDLEELRTKERFLLQLADIISSYQMAGITKNISQKLMSDISLGEPIGFSEDEACDVATLEVSRVSEVFKTYYNGVFGPVSDDDIRAVAYLKVLTYYKQAQVLKDAGFRVLLNTEMPADARERMYNLAREPRGPRYLSVINPNAKK